MVLLGWLGVGAGSVEVPCSTGICRFITGRFRPDGFLASGGISPLEKSISSEDSPNKSN